MNPTRFTKGTQAQQVKYPNKLIMDSENFFYSRNYHL